MDAIELKVARAGAEAFCAANLKECCIELNEWRTKGVLRDGKLRELGELCEKYVGSHDGLKNAEAMVDFQACAKVAAPVSAPTAGEQGINREWIERIWMACNQDLFAFAREVQARSAGDAVPAGVASPCRTCNGTGWVVRDPDIGTDQECFVCDGAGAIGAAPAPGNTAQPKEHQEHVLPPTRGTEDIDSEEFRLLLDALWKSMGLNQAARARNAIFRHIRSFVSRTVEAELASRCRVQGGNTKEQR